MEDPNVMNVPLEITYRNVNKTESLETLIRRKAAKLKRVYPDLSSCRVAVEKGEGRPDRLGPFRVRVDITVPPGRAIYASNDNDRGDLNHPLTRIVRRVFKAARRQLKELRKRQHPSRL